MLVCIVAFFLLRRLPFAIYYLKKHIESTKHFSKKPDDNLEKSMEVTPLLHLTEPQPKIIDVFRTIWKHALTVFFVFFVTLSLFPGMTSLIKKSSTKLNQDWFQIILIALFMIFDFLGRTTPRLILLFKPKFLFIPTILRISFFILFIFCIHPRYITSDYVAYLLMIFFAYSNGLCGTLAMIYGPTTVKESQREIAGTTMSFFLNFGIFAGVHFALLLLYLVTGNIGIKF
jgi:equilibrative nucleoside transporter 1/2/3